MWRKNVSLKQKSWQGEIVQLQILNQNITKAPRGTSLSQSRKKSGVVVMVISSKERYMKHSL